MGKIEMSARCQALKERPDFKEAKMGCCSFGGFLAFFPWLQ